MSIMNCDNPYQSPEQGSLGRPEGETGVRAAQQMLSEGTLVPRYVAAFLDNLLAIIVAVVAAKCVANDMPLLQGIVLVAAYLAYYLLSEGVLSRTVGKLVTGLVVVRTDGQPCSWWQIVVRTGFRALEVNPVLLGAVPAALCIIFSKRHQRFGDKFARTVVVSSRRLSTKQTVKS
jgi:uncharacterized RDD family membrane protein YckC